MAKAIFGSYIPRGYTAQASAQQGDLSYLLKPILSLAGAVIPGAGAVTGLIGAGVSALSGGSSPTSSAAAVTAAAAPAVAKAVQAVSSGNGMDPYLLALLQALVGNAQVAQQTYRGSRSHVRHVRVKKARVRRVRSSAYAL